ncbi:CBS domain-containing protein [Halobaculum sp. MBLA0147]|uniref:CBS domain-containing protein n=1 Tax=Halobaculum sp. MBLA0147 TaxID=3079934 RepID=UPI003525A3C8
MDISEIAVREFVEVAPDDRLGQIQSLFDRDAPRGVVVVDDGEVQGVIGERDLIRSRVEEDTKAAALAKSAPAVDRDEDVREVARVLVEGGVKIAPVYEGESLYGVVTADAILEAVLDNLDAITVGDISTDEPITIHEDAHVGQAINRLREHGISRLPVLDEDGDLSGILTTHDIVDFVVRDDERQGRGDRSGDLDRMLDIPVYDMMSAPVITAAPEETVEDAVRRMLEEDVAGLVVTGDAATDVAGVVTKTDVLRALTFTEEETLDVQITNVELVDGISREEIRESIAQVAEKYQEMTVVHAHVRFHEHKEKLRGTPLLQAQIRLRTSHGQVAGSGEGYGADHAFHVALDKLERNVLELKGVVADERYRGQLLRKLGGL